MHPAEHNTLLLEHRNAALTSLYLSKDFNDCINKMDPEHLREDLKAEVMLILMEKEPELIVGLEQRGELKFFTVRIILNQVRSNTSPFVVKYRQCLTFNDDEEYIDNSIGDKKQMEAIVYLNGAELPTRLRRECQSDAVMRYINNELYWYDKAIMLLYIKHGSYRLIEKETRIPWESCYSTVRKCITKIRQEVLNVVE